MNISEITALAKNGDIVRVRAREGKLRRLIKSKLKMKEVEQNYAGYLFVYPKSVGISNDSAGSGNANFETAIYYEDILDFEVLKKT